MKIRMLMALVLLISGALSVAEEKWLTDFEAAKKQAEEKKLPILADFSGSDWCGWCNLLDSEVFSKKAFLEHASTNYILFVADFPMHKVLPEETAKQNTTLAEKYDIKGFPTVLILDKSGKELARTGYREGGEAAYIEHLKQLLENSSKEADKKK